MSDLLLMRGSPLRQILSTSGLVAAYLPYLQIAQSATGQSLIDYSGNGNHAQLGSTAGADANDPSWGTNALTFDGDDSALLPVLSNLRSYSIWVNMTALTTSQVILSCYDSGIALGYSSNSNAFLLGHSEKRTCALGTFTTGQWNHVFAHYSATGTPTVYINGVEPSYGADTYWVITSAESYLGRRAYSSPLYYNGSIGDVALFSRELSQAEILRIYHMGRIGA